MISYEEQKLIDYCKNAGYGWEKFASSVEASGRVTKAQLKTLYSMKGRISLARLRAYSYSGDVDPDISDCEAMRSGDFF